MGKYYSTGELVASMNNTNAEIMQTYLNVQHNVRNVPIYQDLLYKFNTEFRSLPHVETFSFTAAHIYVKFSDRNTYYDNLIRTMQGGYNGLMFQPGLIEFTSTRTAGIPWYHLWSEKVKTANAQLGLLEDEDIPLTYNTLLRVRQVNAGLVSGIWLHVSHVEHNVDGMQVNVQQRQWEGYRLGPVLVQWPTNMICPRTGVIMHSLGFVVANTFDNSIRIYNVNYYAWYYNAVVTRVYFKIDLALHNCAYRAKLAVLVKKLNKTQLSSMIRAHLWKPESPLYTELEYHFEMIYQRKQHKETAKYLRKKSAKKQRTGF